MSMKSAFEHEDGWKAAWLRHSLLIVAQPLSDIHKGKKQKQEFRQGLVLISYASSYLALVLPTAFSK